MKMLGTAQKLRQALRNLPAWPEASHARQRGQREDALVDVGVARHLEETAHWLTRAQAASPRGGVSAGWHFRLGWMPPFPETTGYIIPSLLDYAEFSEEAAYRERALALARWMVAVQLPDGGVRTGIGLNETSTIFDTGQGLFGFVRAYLETREESFLGAACKAGDWLLAHQDADGCWRRGEFRAVPHCYNTRTAWALLRLGLASGEERYRAAGAANLEWARGRQQADGWFADAAFHPTEAPLTHTIAYTLQGLLEGGLLLADARHLSAVRSAAAVLRDRVSETGWLAGTYAEGWQGDESFSCLTGNAQTAIVFFILAGLDGDDRWIQAGKRLTAGLRRGQDLEARHPGVRGGIRGSRPVDGKYSPWAMLNWAAKFHLDALLLESALARTEPRRWVLHG